MRALGVVPARWGSTRLPGKILQPLLGKPLIQWVLERARRAATLDDLIVAADDERILAAANAIGIEAVMTRKDHPSGTDRIAEAIAGRVSDRTVVVNIQGDEPLIDPALIDRLVALMLEEPETPMATAAVPVDRLDDLLNPAVVKVVCDSTGCALYFSRAPIPYHREAPARIVAGGHFRHLGLYAYRAWFLSRFVSESPGLLERTEKLEQLRALHIGARIKVVIGSDKGVAVDTPEDLPAAEEALRDAIRKGTLQA